MLTFLAGVATPFVALALFVWLARKTFARLWDDAKTGWRW